VTSTEGSGGPEGRRVVIVGGVAGGMSVATRLRRLDETARITVVERSGHVSYANCGLPYFVGGVIDEEEDLFIQTPQRLHDLFRLEVRIGTEARAVDPVARTVTVRGPGAVTEDLPYDVLVLSPGAVPVRPAVAGSEHLHLLRTVEDAESLAGALEDEPREAVVVGAGFVGLEVAENLRRRGLGVTVVEALDQVLSPLDPELAVLVATELAARGVRVLTGTNVVAVGRGEVVLGDGRHLAADLALASVGVRPDTRLAEGAGLRLGPTGGIAVDEHLRTSDPHIYAVGDAVEKVDGVGGGSSLIALANVANRQGRRLADQLCGLDRPGSASLGTAIVKVFGLTAACTGWNEKRLRRSGRPYRAVHSHPLHHAGYYPGAEPMALKLLFDPADGTILGAQAVGRAGVDKRIDVLATAMAGGITADGLADLELAYAPPFSSAKDPVNLLGYMAENVRSGACDVVAPDELDDLAAEGWVVLDVRTAAEHAQGAIPGSRNVPLDRLRTEVGAGDGPFVVYCEVGQRGHTATALLLDRGIGARNLDGGYRTWLAARAAAARDCEVLRDQPL
jgi:NADPH-dependent 2,4-dienoyl-CoA reductase/sulfur reductase-like enzyme/rhodanese-related sulfurtransferase